MQRRRGHRHVSRDAARHVRRDRAQARRRRRGSRAGPVWLLNRAAGALDARSELLREPRPGSLTANFHVVATVRRLAMRLFRRNALGIYAVYAASIVSGLVVTPILLHAIGDEAFGIWSFIGAVTIYLVRARSRRRPVGRPLRRRGARAADARGHERDRVARARALRRDRARHAAGRASCWPGSCPPSSTPRTTSSGRRASRRSSSSSRSPRASRSASSTTCSSASSASTS